jgi:hypothetical protein
MVNPMGLVGRGEHAGGGERSKDEGHGDADDDDKRGHAMALPTYRPPSIYNSSPQKHVPMMFRAG